jgi:hypothetical protein
LHAQNVWAAYNTASRQTCALSRRRRAARPLPALHTPQRNIRIVFHPEAPLWAPGHQVVGYHQVVGRHQVVGHHPRGTRIARSRQRRPLIIPCRAPQAPAVARLQCSCGGWGVHRIVGRSGVFCSTPRSCPSAPVLVRAPNCVCCWALCQKGVCWAQLVPQKLHLCAPSAAVCHLRAIHCGSGAAARLGIARAGTSTQSRGYLLYQARPAFDSWRQSCQRAHRCTFHELRVACEHLQTFPGFAAVAVTPSADA